MSEAYGEDGGEWVSVGSREHACLMTGVILASTLSQTGVLRLSRLSTAPSLRSSGLCIWYNTAFVLESRAAYLIDDKDDLMSHVCSGIPRAQAYLIPIVLQ